MALESFTGRSDHENPFTDLTLHQTGCRPKAKNKAFIHTKIVVQEGRLDRSVSHIRFLHFLHVIS